MIITNYCTGCRACEQLCPKQCISMIADEEGFLTAKIDESRCIECGLCKKRCPQNNLIHKTLPLRVVATRYKDDIILSKSASGGAFVAIAKRILEQKGIVVGAAYLDNLVVGHVCVDNINELYKLQSSKYVQSDTLSTYWEIKTYLEEERLVLFSGTSCQVAGLKAYLHRDYTNLLTIDLICHGVPSPLMFAKYLTWLGNRYKGNIKFYNFRDKSRGWGLVYMAKTKTKTKTIAASLDPYYYHFLQGNIYRECCYKCNYCTKERIGDFTIGDYWGIEKEHPQFYSTKGVSLILINSDKAQKYFKWIETDFYIQESSFEQAAHWNHNLKAPTIRNDIRNHIYKEINTLTAIEYIDKSLRFPFSYMSYLKDKMPSKIKLFIRKIVK